MRYPKHTLELFCDIDGTKVGEAQTLTPMTQQEYRQKTGIVDLRCSACETAHGAFKDLTEEYVRKTGHKANVAEAFVQLYRKRADFEAPLKAIVDRIEREKRDKIN
jgi:hypothetical protein